MKIHTIPLGIDNCYLLEGEKCVFIDGGAPNQSRAFVKGMAALGIAPSKVAIIILTHAHWDHIGSVHALVELTGAKLAVHTRERAIVERGLKSMPPGVTLWGSIFGAILRAFLPFITIPPSHVDIEIGDDGLSRWNPTEFRAGWFTRRVTPGDRSASSSITGRPSLAIWL